MVSCKLAAILLMLQIQILEWSYLHITAWLESMNIYQTFISSIHMTTCHLVSVLTEPVTYRTWYRYLDTLHICDHKILILWYGYTLIICEPIWSITFDPCKQMGEFVTGYGMKLDANNNGMSHCFIQIRLLWGRWGLDQASSLQAHTMGYGMWYPSIPLFFRCVHIFSIFHI